VQDSDFLNWQDFNIEAYEILELLCELLHERIRVISNSTTCPPDLAEAIASVMWASTQIDVTELVEVRKQFGKKFGSKFVQNIETNTENVVNPRLFKKLSIQPPSASLVMRYLTEIAKEYNIDWQPTDLDLPEGGIESSHPMLPPSGFSVPMAPGSGLASVYQRANADPSAGNLPPFIPNPLPPQYHQVHPSAQMPSGTI
jgi:vacuolar protein sorting-associated protein IST1